MEGFFFMRSGTTISRTTAAVRKTSVRAQGSRSKRLKSDIAYHFPSVAFKSEIHVILYHSGFQLSMRKRKFKLILLQIGYNNIMAQAILVINLQLLMFCIFALDNGAELYYNYLAIDMISIYRGMEQLGSSSGS